MENSFESICFVTIKIFARTEPMEEEQKKLSGFVTIKIFARTEHGDDIGFPTDSFVTIKIFARTERLMNSQT